MQNTQQNYTPEDLLLAYIFGDVALRIADIMDKPLSEITIADLPLIREMPVPPDGIILYDMTTGDKRSGYLEYTEEMKNNFVRFAKENVKELILKRRNSPLN